MIACYRIEHDGWTPQAAQREATEHGRRWVQIGMRHFITRFAARATPCQGIHRVEPFGAGLILRLESDCQHADPRRPPSHQAAPKPSLVLFFVRCPVSL